MMRSNFHRTIWQLIKLKTSTTNVVKDLIRSSKFFWKFRHLIEPDIWETYQKDSVSKRRDFYVNFARKHNLTTVFEFGCGSGANYANIKNAAPEIAYFGFDISSAAITKAKASFEASGVEFHSKLNIHSFEKFLKNHSTRQADIAIYDRVLYLLSDEEIHEHLEIYSRYFTFIIVDDFHSNEMEGAKGSYRIRNFQKLFEKFDFDSLTNEESEHKSGSAFFSAYARRMVLKNNKVKFCDL